MSAADDERRVRDAARRVGLWVGLASTVVIALGVVILIAVILATSRPDRPGPDTDRDHDFGNLDHIVVDVDRVLPWVIGLGVIGVLLLGLIAWFAARRAVQPLSEALRAQRNFVSDASHELRTPLTALSSRIQILQRRHDRGEPIDDTIADLRRNATVMDDVLTDMLLAAEADAAPAGSSADVGACAHAAADSLRPIAAERGVEVEVAVEGRPTARMSAVTLTRVCAALLDNAVQHAPAGTSVVVSARSAGQWMQLRVSDHGSGIGPEDAERVFDRFARSGETGNRRGFGLGLALVRDVVVRSGGTVSIESTSPAGTTFLVQLPST
jgi:signal transduction histidine kinase